MVTLASLGWRRGGMFGFLSWDWRPFELKYRTTFSLQTLRPIVIHVWRILGPFQPPVDFDLALLPELGTNQNIKLEFYIIT